MLDSTFPLPFGFNPRSCTRSDCDTREALRSMGYEARNREPIFSVAYFLL